MVSKGTPLDPQRLMFGERFLFIIYLTFVSEAKISISKQTIIPVLSTLLLLTVDLELCYIRNVKILGLVKFKFFLYI